MLTKAHTKHPRHIFHRSFISSVSKRFYDYYDVAIIGGGPVGLFLSKLLDHLKVHHCVIERRLIPTSHPQAHFLNARTSEILQIHHSVAYEMIVSQATPSNYWRHFIYCYNVLGREFHRVDQFSTRHTPEDFWESTPANVLHIPQSRLESIFRSELVHNNKYGHHFFGSELVDMEPTQKKSYRLTLNSGESILSRFVIGADGAHSLVRKKSGIDLAGLDNLQTLINVHFCCTGIREKLVDREGMLYFVFNEKVVAVLVAHDIDRNEWVCQIPIFPPYQSAESFDESAIQRLLVAAMGCPSDSIRVLSTKSWTMSARVASDLVKGGVILVGDAAHQLPPAGGFGLNTGLQDAHNLAWKLAATVHGQASKELLDTYHSERHPIAVENCLLSLENFSRTAAVAAVLGVDPALAAAVVQFPFPSLLPHSLRALAVNSALQTGLLPLALLRQSNGLREGAVRTLRRMLEGNPGGLPLLFPEHDLNFDYGLAEEPCGAAAKRRSRYQMWISGDFPSLQHRLQTSSASQAEATGFRPRLRPGARVPHCWFGGAKWASSVGLASLSSEGAVAAEDSQLLTLVVFAGSLAAWTMLLAAQPPGTRKLFAVVSVEDSGGQHVGLDHAQLQRSLQQPHFSHPDDSKNSPPAPGGTLDWSYRRNDLGDLPCLVVVDVVGGWREICGDVSAVVLRPDGHVADIYPNASGSSASEFLQSLVRDLHLSPESAETSDKSTSLP